MTAAKSDRCTVIEIVSSTHGESAVQRVQCRECGSGGREW